MAAAATLASRSRRHRSKFIVIEHAAAPFWHLHPPFPLSQIISSAGARQLAGHWNAVKGVHRWGAL
jgi:hypothetical protein